MKSLNLIAEKAVRAIVIMLFCGAGLVGCGSDHDSTGGSTSTPAVDAFFTAVSGVVVTSPDDTEPTSVDSFTATSPEDTEPQPLS